MREQGKNPYPHKFSRTHRIDEVVAQFEPRCPPEAKGQYLDEEVRLTGRVSAIRSAGKKLIFYDLYGDHAKIQI